MEVGFSESLAIFDYAIKFSLPKKVVSCYVCLFNVFCVRNGSQKQRTVHIEVYMDLVDDIRYAFIVDDGHGLTVGV